ncbi:MAG TPA: pyruvate dehydrogenase (acetyl-transferring), homodimeric type [Candidatus Limnocylindrales bacterium]|nr:pyruvate dehydrogenase (acetyl-transferring), homodimeric type [Candidatus Limnocylindrales bacterium]
MYLDEFKHQLPDLDEGETDDWIQSLDDVVRDEGETRARFLLFKLLKRARQLQVGLPPLTNTRYINTISPEQEPQFPGDEVLERRIRRLIRWNAVAMVLRANSRFSGIGGHLATYASAATLYEVGFNWFFRGREGGGEGTVPGDQIFYQGHAAPGIYARAFLEGRLTEDQLDHFRRETPPQHGLSSYPHPRLMPDFWEFPTVSMGLGPISAIYQARYNRYLQNRGLLDTSGSRVWAFLGDGETDESEALGALHVAAQEGLDNLTFVVNCNLQRLDGPVRGNGKIIQELEAVFRGSGWNVIKVIWGREWDELLANDRDGVLVEKMNTTVDGEFQKFSVAGGAYIREHFFGPDARLRELVATLSDDDLSKLRRGGHDYRKVYAAYEAATQHKGVPTVILAKTVKGWTLGPGVEARNITHQAKKLSEAELRVFRDRLELPIPDDRLHDAPYYHPGPDSEEVQYLMERRRALGGPLPRRFLARGIELPAPKATFDAEFAAGSQTAVSTTMAFTRMLRNLMRDPDLGPRIVPIIPDEARTFGMDPLFNEVGIYASGGQRYEPVDSELVLKYREATNGQVLEEGISEAGSAASFQAAGTSYATHGLATIPFYIFYSMFGFQRTGDQFWAAGDARTRGFLMGATAGRTTLTGEGLQHDDGHTQILASTNPAVRPYDPTFAYELAAIIRDGIERMHVKGEDLIYYITLYNENYAQAPKPEANGKSPDAITDGILKGLYKFASAPSGVAKDAPKVRLVGSGSILLQVLAGQALLAERCGVAAEVYSAPSFAALRRDALEVDRWNRLHPASKPRIPYVSTVLGPKGGPVVAASDWMKILPQGLAPWIPGELVALGTDGFGRSDTREALRAYFEIDGPSIAAAAMSALARVGDVTADAAARAIADLGVDPDKVDPLSA